MILVAKVKFVFKMEWANGIKKKDFKDVKLQETPTCTFHFKLSEVRAFSDNDIEYIIEKLPKFSDFKTKVKSAKGELIARQDEIVEFLKKWKPVKFDTLTSANSRIKLSTKIEHYIDYETDQDIAYQEFVPGTYIADSKISIADSD